MQRFDPSRPDFSPYGFRCELWTPARMPRPNRHNEVELNYLTSGSLTYLFGSGRTVVRSGRLAVFWAAIPHQIVDHEGEAPYFVATVPLSDFLQMGHELQFVNRLLRGQLVTDSVPDDSDEIKFRQWERELRGDEPAAQAAARLEIQARLMRLAQRCRGRASATRPASRLSRADQIACHIAQNYQQPLTAQSIADAIGIHPNYAMSLFRDSFGATMTSFIADHRISHAQRLLATTDDSILNIALASGFQSLSRFNEAFKKRCGCAPRDYRNSQTGGGHPQRRKSGS